MRRLVLLLILVAGCATALDETPEEGDEVEDDPIAEEDPADVVTEPLPAPAPGTLRVVQMNPYYAGRLAPYTEHQNSCSRVADCNVSGRVACSSSSQVGCWECIDHECRNRTWESMTNGARLFDAIRADVIGIQELNPSFAGKIDSIIEAATETSWSYRTSSQGINNTGSGVGVYWRSDRVELVANLGSVIVDELASGYIVRFHGVILRQKSTQRQFGFFSGKLVWGSSGDDEDRRIEAVRLKAWVDTQMAKYPLAKARIIATDLNDTIGSGAYDVFQSWDDGDAVKPTSNAASPKNRIDYLFWADSKSGATRQGFVTARSDNRLGRSMYYGSDHRFVYGDALIP
jgi:hypothetical protein